MEGEQSGCQSRNAEKIRSSQRRTKLLIQQDLLAGCAKDHYRVSSIPPIGRRSLGNYLSRKVNKFSCVRAILPTIMGGVNYFASATDVSTADRHATSFFCLISRPLNVTAVFLITYSESKKPELCFDNVFHGSGV